MIEPFVSHIQSGPVRYLCCQLSELVTTRCLLLVRGVTLNAHHRPVLSRDARVTKLKACQSMLEI